MAEIFKIANNRPKANKNSINDLKNNLYELTEVSFDNVGYLKGDGTIGTNTGWVYSNYINPFDLRNAIVDTFNIVACIIYYDENKNIISYIDSKEGEYEIDLAAIPENAVYCRLCTRVGSTITSCYYYKHIVEFKDLYSNVDVLMKNISKYIPSDETLSINPINDFNTFTSNTLKDKYYSNSPITEKGFLKSIAIKSDATSVNIISGTIENNTFTKLHDYGTFVINNDVINVSDNKHLLIENEYIFIQQTGGNLYFTSDAGAYKLISYQLTSGQIFEKNSQILVAFNVVLSLPQIEQKNLIDECEELENNINAINEKNLNIEKYISIFEDSFNELSTEWINTNWSLNSDNSISPTAFGTIGTDTNAIILNRSYACDKRIFRLDVILYNDSVFNIRCKRTSDNTGEGESIYIIDIPNKKIKFCKEGTNGRGVLTSTFAIEKNITEFDFENGGRYVIEMEKNDYTFSLKITNYKTLKTAICSLVGWTGGRQLGRYSIYQTAGTYIKINSVKVLMANNPYIAFMGDSITEGVLMSSLENINKRWDAMIRDKVGNCVISAMGGGTSIDLIQRLTNEMEYIKPKYIVVTIGTNGGTTTNTLSQYQTIISKCNEIGSVLILNHIPANATSSQNYIAVNNLIDSTGYTKGCKFDIATSVDNDITKGVNSSFMSDGTTHPNAIGSLAMYNRICFDVPELLKMR